MRRFLLFLLLLVLIGAAGVALFLATFDADRYRPVVVRRMSEAVGRPVRLEKISLRWDGGIAIDLQGLAVDPGVRKGHVLLTPRRFSLNGPIPVRAQAALFRAEPNVSLIGEITLPSAGRPFSMSRMRIEADLTGLDREEVARAIPHQRSLAGEVSAEGKVYLQMDRMELGPQGPAGRLHLRVEQGRLLRLNLLRELFSRLTVIPGLMETLSARLPDSYRQKFEAQDTVFQPIDLWLSASGQGFVVEGTRLATDSFELAIGQARIGREGSVAASARFRAEAALSKAVIESVEELRFLADESDQLTLPVVVQGILPKVTILPDLSFVTQQLFSVKGEELLGGLLQKVLKKK